MADRTTTQLYATKTSRYSHLCNNGSPKQRKTTGSVTTQSKTFKDQGYHYYTYEKMREELLAGIQDGMTKTQNELRTMAASTNSPSSSPATVTQPNYDAFMPRTGFREHRDEVRKARQLLEERTELLANAEEKIEELEDELKEIQQETTRNHNALFAAAKDAVNLEYEVCALKAKMKEMEEKMVEQEKSLMEKKIKAIEILSAI